MIGCHHETPREVMQTQDFKTISPFPHLFADSLAFKTKPVFTLMFYAQIFLQKSNSFYELNRKSFSNVIHAFQTLYQQYET